jgi:hypothetical protein
LLMGPSKGIGIKYLVFHFLRAGKLLVTDQQHLKIVL